MVETFGSIYTMERYAVDGQPAFSLCKTSNGLQDTVLAEKSKCMKRDGPEHHQWGEEVGLEGRGLVGVSTCLSSSPGSQHGPGLSRCFVNICSLKAE